MTEAMVDDALVEVTQADTDLAVRILEQAGGRDHAARFIRARGEGDQHPFVQRIARHRLAGVAAGREEAGAKCDQTAASCRAELKEGPNDGRTISFFDGAIWACTVLATAIRQRGG